MLLPRRSDPPGDRQPECLSYRKTEGGDSDRRIKEYIFSWAVSEFEIIGY
jgi:hypothetical protein